LILNEWKAKRKRKPSLFFCEAPIDLDDSMHPLVGVISVVDGLPPADLQPSDPSAEGA
jgi:hypothetical protein